MNKSDRELWTKEIKNKYPDKYYSAYAKKPDLNPAGNFELLEKINKLNKDIQELKTQNLNMMVRLIKLEQK